MQMAQSWQRGCSFFYRAQNARMGIVGNVVGDGGNLSFGAGKAPELQVLKPRIVRPAIQLDRM